MWCGHSTRISPYDRFILEQLAADLLRDLKDRKDLAALGFLTVGQRIGTANDVINDRIDVVGRGLQGLTVACARCHDHMFDPISIKDYYALHGVFASSVEPKEDELPVILEGERSAGDKFAKEVELIDARNREMFYDLVAGLNSEFRRKAGDYLLSLMQYLSESEEDKQASVKLQEGSQLDSSVWSALRTQILQFRSGRGRAGIPVKGENADRVYPREDTVLAPMLKFMGAPKDSWGTVAQEISENRRGNYHPLIAKAFQGTSPKTFQEVAAAYARVFQEVNAKGATFVKLSAEAIQQGAKLTGVSEGEARLLSVPYRIRIAAELDSRQIQEEMLPWREITRNLKPWEFNKLNQLKMTGAGAVVRAMVVNDSPQPKNSRVFLRGQSSAPGPEVPRRFLSVLAGGNPKPFDKGSGRLELAQSIADRRNPLTARVMVNRVWMHHFGEGFVRTPDDLGTQGEAPTHPELLDYLSSYFMEQGWSLKHLHKLIMLSRVYQESSYTVPAHEQMDPFNRLLWRANVRRLEFEAVRDSLLVFSGQIDRTLGGPPVNITDEPYIMRRSVYGYVDRGELPELMSHFDFADPLAPNSKRTTTVVPQQALFLMNSPMVVDVARRVLARPEVVNARDNLNRVFHLYRIVFQRDPKPAEIQLALEFVGREIKEEPQTLALAKELAEPTPDAKKKKGGGRTAREESLSAIQNEGLERVERKLLTPWETYAQALLLSNEAAYVN
jgi:hypothetical protein